VSALSNVKNPYVVFGTDSVAVDKDAAEKAIRAISQKFAPDIDYQLLIIPRCPCQACAVVPEDETQKPLVILDQAYLSFLLPKKSHLAAVISHEIAHIRTALEHPELSRLWRFYWWQELWADSASIFFLISSGFSPLWIAKGAWAKIWYCLKYKDKRIKRIPTIFINILRLSNFCLIAPLAYCRKK
jgi:hypothetical protein